jgi:hypothetical protein
MSPEGLVVIHDGQYDVSISPATLGDHLNPRRSLAMGMIQAWVMGVAARVIDVRRLSSTRVICTVKSVIPARSPEQFHLLAELRDGEWHVANKQLRDSDGQFAASHPAVQARLA